MSVDVKWSEVFAIKCLNLPNIDNMSENHFEIYKRYLIADIIENGYIFSGEYHKYGKGCPVFYESRKPVGAYICTPDAWARFMTGIWNSKYKEDLKIHEFRNENTMPKFVEQKFPV